jgi:hypothetical protein
MKPNTYYLFENGESPSQVKEFGKTAKLHNKNRKRKNLL